MSDRLSFLAGLAVSVLLAGAGFGRDTSSPAATRAAPSSRNSSLPVEPDAPLQLPTVTVNSASLKNYPPIPKTDLSGGGLDPSEPSASLFFPGSAYSEGIRKGYARVSVELDDKGNATDCLIIAYTEKYFGDALLRTAKETQYSPLLFKGVAIPYRFNFGYEFRPESTVAINSLTAIEHRQLAIRGGRPDFKYQPVTEDELDSRLEYVRQAVPNFPPGYVPLGGKGDWVMVTLFVDEQGEVRVPNVESASSPLLIGNALKTVHYWRFKPPTVKGKPVLVYAAFALKFMSAGR